MATKDWNGFKKNGDTYIPNDATARTGLQNKVDKVTGKGLSTNDYDNTAKAVVSTAQDNIKANTKLIKDTVGWSGKNKLGIIGESWTAQGAIATDQYGVRSELLEVNEGDKFIFSKKVAFTDSTKNGIVRGFNASKEFVQSVGNLSYNSTKNIVTIPSGIKYIGVVQFCESIVTQAVLDTNEIQFYDATILDDTYEPYFGSTAFPRSEQAVLGAKNRLKYSSDVYTKTISGVTFTLNSDNSLSLSGTASENIFFNLVNASDVPKSEAQILSGCPKGGSMNTYVLRWNTGGTNLYDSGDGVVIPANTVLLTIEIRIQSGYNTNGLIFKPMLRLASDPDDTYQPYAMTNQMLTAFITGRIQTINLGNRSTCKLIPTDIANQQIFLVILTGSSPVLNGLFVAVVYSHKGAMITEISPTSGHTIAVNADGELEITTGSTTYRRILVISSAEFTIE